MSYDLMSGLNLIFLFYSHSEPVSESSLGKDAETGSA